MTEAQRVEPSVPSDAAETKGYYSQDLGQLWSGKTVREAYSVGVHFGEGILPFGISEIGSGSDSVLEIGSSFGQCYRFLLSRGVDLGSRYTGIDISEEGVGHCRELYPEANWVMGDFRTTDLGRTFDYVVEKNAIHHMPQPLDCLAKAVGLTDKSIMIYLRVRTLHETLSDIEKGYMTARADDGEPKGRYFYNLVNLSEMVDTILSAEGVAKVAITLAPHDTASTLAGGWSALPPDVFDSREQLYYCRCLVTKGDTSTPRISVNPMRLRPFVLEGLKRPASVSRFYKTRRKILAQALSRSQGR